MNIHPISFGAAFTVKQGPKSGIDAAGMNKEVIVAEKARQIGIDVPTYNIALNYETKGETASYPANKIEPKHFPSLFKSLFLMDKNNLNHNDLDIGHVFTNGLLPNPEPVKYGMPKPTQLICKGFCAKWNPQLKMQKLWTTKKVTQRLPLKLDPPLKTATKALNCNLPASKLMTKE